MERNLSPNTKAACLRIKLRKLDRYLKGRTTVASVYTHFFSEANLGDFVRLPLVDENSAHVWHQFTVRVKNRDQLKAYLEENGVSSSIYYPVPMHLQPNFADLGYKRGDLHVCEKLSREVLSLPMCPELASEQIEYVVRTIADFL